MHSAVSVIIPVDRPGADATRALDSLLTQTTEVAFEVIVVSGSTIALPDDPRIRAIVLDDRNPARRRNRAAAIASSETLAFIDDDAFADERWIQTAVDFLSANPDVAIVGGPDPAPPDSGVPELISETLLATPLIGSGVLCHENRAGVRNVRSPHDLALVNLFVRTAAFRSAGGFDESIGYIGEDTGLIAKVLASHRVVYHSGLVVRHRRRAFPGPYLRQRWRYRIKTGAMLLRPESGYARSAKIWALLVAGFAFLFALLLAPVLAAVLLAIYLTAVSILGARATRLPPRWWWTIPPAFFAHHTTYFLGIVIGAVRAMLSVRT